MSFISVVVWAALLKLSCLVWMCTGIRKATRILAWLPLQLRCIGPEYQCNIQYYWGKMSIQNSHKHVLGKGRIAIPSIGKTCSAAGGRSRSDTNLREHKQNWSLFRILVDIPGLSCGHEWDTMLALAPLKHYSPRFQDHTRTRTPHWPLPVRFAYCDLSYFVDRSWLHIEREDS